MVLMEPVVPGGRLGEFNKVNGQDTVKGLCYRTTRAWTPSLRQMERPLKWNHGERNKGNVGISLRLAMSLGESQLK